MKIYQAICDAETSFFPSEVLAKKQVTAYKRNYGDGYMKAHEIEAGKKGLIAFLNKYELHRRQLGK